MERLAARGCDAVALACTEIPLLVTPEVAPLPTLDSARLLARAAYDAAMGHHAMPTWRGGPLRSLGPCLTGGTAVYATHSWPQNAT
jgi:aspartate racemase